MNIFLNFKSHNHEMKFQDNLELSFSRMVITHSVLCISVVPFYPLVQYFSFYATVGADVVIRRTAINWSVNLGLLALALLLRKYRRKLDKRPVVARWALDILYCLVEAYEAYLWSEAVALNTSFQRYFWGWWNALTAIIKINMISRWYLKLVAYLTLIVTFGIQTFVDHQTYTSAVIIGQAVIFLVLHTYFQERSDKMRFLEKQTLIEETEALREIMEQTTEAIVVYGIDEGVLYKNSNKFEWWDESLAFEANLGRVLLEKKTLSESFRISVDLTNSKERMDLYTMIEHLRIEHRQRKKVNTSQRKLDEHLNTEVKIVYGDVPNGDEKIYQLEIRILHMTFREKPALALIISDVTQRNTIITLQDNHNYKNRLLASVSHELRTPLNASINFTRMAIEDPTVPTNIKDEYLSPSLVSNQLLLHLINDILDFSQISENKLRLVYERLSFKDSIEQCINLIKLQASRKRIELEVGYQMNCLTSDFSTDHNRLKQIVLNLLSNAIKFTLEGKIKITARLDQQQNPIELTPSNFRKRLHISVEDTGIGMTSDDKRKLFQAFEKIGLDDRAAINSTGVGLGLVISNNLVKMLNHPDTHDNQINVESEKDVGTKFSFTILEQEDSGLYTIKASQDENYTGLMEEQSNKTDEQLTTDTELLGLKACYFRSLSEKRRLKAHNRVKIPKLPSCTCPPFLVVDDDIFNLTALESILKRIGFSCHTAFNGKQAIAKIIERKNAQKCGHSCISSYQAIFMDCSMPIMDGFEASRILKNMMANGEIPDIPIIACTAFVQEREKRRAEEAGMTFHTIKPLTQEKIQLFITKIENYNVKK